MNAIVKDNEFKTPVGRLVLGSLYVPQTTDPDGKPLLIRNGAKAGQPTQRYFFALAIPKMGESHWSQTEWGAKIKRVGEQGFPGGQHASPNFAWKVKDGDSQTPNRRGVIESNREGYRGNWILNYSSSFAPALWHAHEKRYITEPDFINLGDYLEVLTRVGDNKSNQQPGIFLQSTVVAFVGYGKRIAVGIDPATIGFGTQPLPAGASLTPLPSSQNNQPPVNPAPVVYPPVMNDAPAYIPPVTQAVPVAPAPYPNILSTPAQPPQKVMTAKAAGLSYEQYIAAGWNDQLLIQHGMMTA